MIVGVFDAPGTLGFSRIHDYHVAPLEVDLASSEYVLGRRFHLFVAVKECHGAWQVFTE
jgi:hypothetical protein